MTASAVYAPLDDPNYTPAHPPVSGAIPDVVGKWGPRSQLRWFQRFRDQLGRRRDWDRFYCQSEHHRGLCCYSCADEYQVGHGPMLDGWCCCRDGRIAAVSGRGVV